MVTQLAADDDWLSERWLDLVTPYTSDSFGVHATWHALESCYTDPRRSYHNLEHVAALLRLLDADRAQLQEPDVVEFAIWFHDAIYDSRAQDNEEKSAAWARQALEAMSVDARRIAQVETCILATRRHDVASVDVPDLAYFLDLDLAILGAGEEDYDRYRLAIRNEYAWASDAQYREGRAAVLQAFLRRPKLYLTPGFAERFEANARTNLERELRVLLSS